MPIQQHPLPQDISSYKFRLIGDMTVKQFLYIAGFIILTILIHNSPIPFFFRYPLEILTLGLGIGLAFVPVQGRPLDQWIIAFIKSIYAPTQYTWQQQQEEITKVTTKKTPSPTPDTKTPQDKKTDPTLATSTTTINLTSPPTQLSPNPLESKPTQQVKTTSPIKFPVDKPLHTEPPKNKEESINIPQTPVVSPTPLAKAPKQEPEKPSSDAPSANLPIPFTPDQPNTIVGLTLNPQGLILEGVLIEIISAGLTIRATKSNKLGQFLFAKSLEKGLYQIKAEKEGFQFTTYSINLEGNIVKPLKIQAIS